MKKTKSTDYSTSLKYKQDSAGKRWATVKALHNETRDLVIEEVAQHIEKLKGFGQDTVSSLAIYIRGMKK